MRGSAWIIVGAGGHARVLAEVMRLQARPVAGYLDATTDHVGRAFENLIVLGSDNSLGEWPDNPLLNGVGGSAGSVVRRRVQMNLEALGRRFGGVCHPSADIAASAGIDETVQLMARCVVQPGAHIERGVIVNTGAIVEHDARIGAFSHCAPGSILCGGVTVGENCHIGAGAVVREGVRLGDGVLVGAGAVVVRDHAGPGGLLLGIPATQGEESGR